MDDKWERALGVLPEQTLGSGPGHIAPDEDTVVDEDELAEVVRDNDEVSR